jgi:hypothetical protein
VDISSRILFWKFMTMPKELETSTSHFGEVRSVPLSHDGLFVRMSLALTIGFSVKIVVDK